MTYDLRNSFRWVLVVAIIINLLWLPSEIQRARAARFYGDGLVAVQRHRYDEAIQNFQRASVIEPRQALYVFAVGQTCALSFPDANANYLLGPTKARAEHKADDCTILSLQKALQLVPNDAIFHEDYGWTLLALGHIDEASMEFSRAVKLEPEDVSYLVALGLDRERNGRFTEAIELYGRALAAGPSLLDSQFYKDFQRRSPKNASVILAHGLELSGGSSPILIARRARILMEMRRFGEAEKDLREAIAELPNLPMAWLNLGKVVAERQNAKEAIVYYRRAASIDTEDIEVMRQMASLAVAQEDNASALNFNIRILVSPTWTEHAKRVYRLYGLRPLSPSDGEPRAFLEFISPDRHAAETCAEVKELFEEQGMEIPSDLDNLFEFAGRTCH